MIPGASVGSYRILSEIASGGSSRIYLAERAGGHLTGQVAVKLLDPVSGAGPGVEHRFRAESRILAGLDHPQIARLFESGVTHEGRLYHVMEYVEGDWITRHCAERNLSLSQRLDLFALVCRAVEYAHGRLVVHGDLKPGNILVTGDGSVKLLDFGIAQMIDRDTTATTTDSLAMTPEYASPEQIRGESVTTATDIYSLGVLLYELLAGRRPYETAGASPAELETIVCERDPAPPSTAAGAGAAFRGLRGDLDNIVLKALSKEPTGRYASARELAEDLSRYRAGLPVLARPLTAGYRAVKFVRRHPLGAAFAGAMGLATAGFLAGMIGLQVATLAARDRARAEARTAREVTEFLLGLFDAGGEDLSARDLLDRGAARAGTMSGDPLVRARMLGVMGRAYSSLGHDDRAELLLQEMVEILRQEHGDDGREVGAALDDLGTVQRLAGRTAESEATHRRAVEILDALKEERGGARLIARSHLGRALAEQGRFEDAEPFVTSAHEEALSRLGRDHPATLSVTSDLAWMRAEQGRYDDAALLYTSVLDARRRLLGPSHPLVAASLGDLASDLRLKGDYAEAERMFRESIEIRRKVLGGDHPSLARTLDNFGVLMATQGRLDEAEALFQESLEILRRRLGREHPEVATAMNNLAGLYHRRGDFSRSASLNEEVIALRRKVLGERHPLVAASLSNLAALYIDMGRFPEAEARARRALEIETEVFGRRNPNTATSIADLAAAIFRQGRLAEAEALHREALSIRRETLGEVNPAVANSLRSVGLVLMEREAYGEAEESLRASLDIRRKVAGERSYRVAQVLNDLGVLMMRRGDLAAAEPLLKESRSMAEEAHGPNHPRVIGTIEHLAHLYDLTGRPEEAAALRVRLSEPE